MGILAASKNQVLHRNLNPQRHVEENDFKFFQFWLLQALYDIGSRLFAYITDQPNLKKCSRKMVISVSF